MSFKFEFKIDYEKLTALLDTFLKSHSDELTSIMGKCLTIQPGGDNNNNKQPSPPVTPITTTSSTIPTSDPPPVNTEPDHKIDNRPLIGDTIPDDPLQNLFSINNTNNNNTTRYQDRNNNPNVKKGFKL